MLQLNSITLLEGVASIGVFSFAHCYELQRVTIPDSVTFINDSAFYWCESLTNFSVGDYNKKYSSKDGVLFNKNKTTLIQYPAKNRVNM